MKPNKHPRGFTLVEIAVVMLVLTIILGVTFQVMRSFQRASAATNRSVQAQEAATTAMESVVALLQTGSIVGLVEPNGYQGNALSFRLPTRDANGDYTLQTVGGQLQVVLAANRTQLIANGTSLVAQQLDGAGVVIPGTAQVLCQNLAPNEDANGNGVLDAGEDLDGDGRLQRGIFFQVLDEDNGNGVLDPGEDGNGNGRLDCSVIVTIDATALDAQGNDHGRVQMRTEIRLRNI